MRDHLNRDGPIGMFIFTLPTRGIFMNESATSIQLHIHNS